MKGLALILAIGVAACVAGCSSAPELDKPTTKDVGELDDVIRILGQKALVREAWASERDSTTAAETSQARHFLRRIARAGVPLDLPEIGAVDADGRRTR